MVTSLIMQQKMTSTSVEAQFAQKLAANDPPTRNKAVKKIKKWFSARTEPFSEVEMMRLWKGLYYCFWMSDKPLVQEELADNISSFVTSFQSGQSSFVFIQSFLQTFGREWVGIDRWRVDKFMMFTRRFLRSVFRFVAKSDWDRECLQSIVDIFEKNLILCSLSKANIGFKLHVTDVFLEELAKAAEEKLSTDNLEIILEPFLKAVKTSDEARYRDHVVERIFRHLLRQSDPGIKWQDEEFAGEDEEDEEDDEDELDNDEKMEGEDGSDVEEGGDSSVKLGEDPRAGGVHSVIPQLAVDYAKLSEKMFSLGSEEGLKKGCRDALYELSKMYKDVANDVFPLGPNLEDVEEDIEKIKVTKTAKKIIREAKEYKKKNIEQKKKYKKGLREDETEQEIVDQNGDGGEVDDAEDNEDEGDDGQDKENNANKLSSKELQKARKREQKKRKRERLLKEKQANEEALAKEKEEKENKDKAAKVLIDKDIERKNAERVKAESNKQKKKKGVLTDKENKLEENVKAHEVLEKKKKKKKKAEEKNMALESELKNSDLTLGQDTSSGEPKKKKKKKKRIEDNIETKEEEHSEVKDQDNDNTEPAVLLKKKKGKSDNDEEIEPVIDETASPAKKLKVSEPIMIKPSQMTTEALETAKEKNKKKKLKKKAIYRIDSDIAFNAPSLSQTNLVNNVSEPQDSKSTSIKSDEPVAKDIPAPAPTSEPKLQKSAEKKKLKKMKKYNAETSLIVNPEETPIIKTPPSVLAFADSTPTSSKTKSNGDLSGPGAAPKNAKIFDENNSWAEDLKPGETEIFIPNKKFKGPDTISGSVPGSPSPMVTPAKSFTATFLKKAMSKSDKKGEKKPKIPDHKAMSEPRKKKVNVVLTKNCAQDFSQHLKSVKNSPQTPHDPNKNPVKSVLKKTPGAETAASLNPVNLNTQLNARSKAAKMLNGKSSRKRAMDFF